MPNATELARRVGLHAERAAIQAMALELERRGEGAAAAAAHGDFARACWATGFAYSEANQAARRALELVPGDPIRVELANNLEKIGAHLACAQVLELDAGGLDSASRRRLACLYYRAGDAETAATHLAELARVTPDSIDALSSIGVLAGWAPDQVSHERGVVAWHEAARRLKSNGDLLGAFEAFHRAFELDPASSLTAERLARELDALGRKEAADEVWRQSAVAAGDSARHDIRAVAALEAGDIVRALAAMLDGRSDVTFDMAQLLAGVEQLLSPRPGISRGFDTVLAELGCADWLAVRLEAGPLLERWTDEANCHVALARLETSYFTQLDPAREALVRAIIAQPAQPEARARLSNWALQWQSPDPLLRALVQSARTAQSGLVARQLAGELIESEPATEELASLRLWSLERIDQTGHLTQELRRELTACRELVASQNLELSQLYAGRSSCTPEERAQSLRRLERRLAVDPTRAIDHLAAVSALLELDPLDQAAQSLYVELLDVAARLVISPSRDERLAAALALAPRLLKDRGCIAQAKFHLRHGQIEPALGALLPLLEDANASTRGLLWLFTLARRFRDAYTSARALERVAAAFRPALRGVLEAMAAEMYLEARATDDALRLSAHTVRTSHNIPRLVTLAARLSDYAEPELDQLDVEHAMSRVLPTARFCRMLARGHRLAGEPDIALAWLQRAVSLRPGDVELRVLQLELALELGDASRLVDIISEIVGQALPIFAWVESAASALAWLTSVDPARSLVVARQLLDYIGASHRSLRAALLDAARVNDDEGFAIDVLERAAAVAADSAQLQLALADRQRKAGNLEAARLAALRAAECGAEVDSWRPYALEGAEGDSADAELLRLELLRLLQLRDKQRDALQPILRRLAVARFDWAHDLEGALTSWLEIARSCADDWGGVVRDMGAVLGNKLAAARLSELAPNIEPSSVRAKVFGLAAQLLEEDGDNDAAIELLEKALVTDPDSMCLLPLAQRVTQARRDVQRLETVYGTLEGSVLGVYGERSLHYRAARTFEHIEEYSAALRHAVAAFEARPDDSGTWRTLVRISQASRQPQAMALSAMRVVEAARDRRNTRDWLLRAYQQLGNDPESLRLKFDLAIRMLVGAPDGRGVIQVAECVRGMTEHGVEEIDFIRLRFERALESLVAELSGPDGARLGIAIAQVAVTELGRFELASRALLGAIQADADLEEFALLCPVLIPKLGEAKHVFATLLQQVLDWGERPYVQFGRDALSLVAQLALELESEPSAVRLLRVVAKCGRDEWFRLEQYDELLPGLFDGKDGRAASVALAGAWLELGHAEESLGVLDRAAQLFSGQSSGAVEQRAVDAGWQAFGQQYLQAMNQLEIPAALSKLRERLLGLEAIVPPAIVGELRVELERRSGDRRALCAALAAFAFVSTKAPAARARLLIEAASIAEALGDVEGALVYYRAAFGTQRSSPVARLRLGTLMVRMGRHRTEDQAKLLSELTTGLESSVDEEQREVAVFLHAEALAALGNARTAVLYLEEAESRIGPRPLIALLLAEHAVRESKPADALGYFAAALGGNWRGLRRLSEVSLLAARAAAMANDIPLALEWLAPALDDAGVRPDALVLEAELRGAEEGVKDSALAAVEAAGTGTLDATNQDSQAAEGAPFESTAPSGSASELVQVIEPSPLLQAAEPSPLLQAIESSALGDRVQAFEPSAPDLVQAIEPSAPVRDQVQAMEPSAPDLVQAIEPSAPVGEPVQALVPSVPARPSTPSSGLIQAAEPDELEMAIAVGEAVRENPEQLASWLPDGKRWLRRWPLSVPLAELVLVGVRSESHHAYAAALQHVVGVLRGERVARAPELSETPLVGDGLRSLLARDLVTPELEALALVWDGAEHEFLLEPSDYAITGVLRVSGTASTIARTYSEVARRFGMQKTPLFYRRSSQALETRILLFSPAGALLEGEVGTDERWIGYRVGCALWATLPEHSLLFGMTTERVLSVLRALSLAFGATEHQQATGGEGESLRLAQVLWQTVRSRSQRRLREICSSPLDYERARFSANQALRRAGLYVCGDLELALHAAAADIGIDATLVEQRRWSEICAAAPDLIDLFQFASCAGYADARWQSGRPIQAGGGMRVP